MAVDHSRLGLENKFLEKRSGRIFLRSTSLLYTILPTNLGCINQPFIFLYITSEGCSISHFFFQDKLHAVISQDGQSWAFSETVQKFPKSPIRPVGSHSFDKFVARAVVECLNEPQ